MQIAALFFLLACVLGLQVCLEQPLNSCMCQLPPMSSVLSFVRANKITTSLVTRNDDGSFTGVKDLLVESAKQLASTAAA